MRWLWFAEPVDFASRLVFDDGSLGDFELKFCDQVVGGDGRLRVASRVAQVENIVPAFNVAFAYDHNIRHLHALGFADPRLHALAGLVVDSNAQSGLAEFL